MSFIVSYDYESGRISITAQGGPYYYRAICREGASGGTGAIVYDSLDDVGYIPIASGRSYTTRWFSLDAETTYTANVLYYSAESAESYVGAMGAYQFATPAAPPPTYTLRATLNYDANGGSGAPAAQTLTGTAQSTSGYVSGYISGTEPTRQGYIFDGWQFSGSSHAPYDAGDSITVYATTGGVSYTLVAQWNSWYAASIYLIDQSLQPLQLYLRRKLVLAEKLQAENQQGGGTGDGQQQLELQLQIGRAHV